MYENDEKKEQIIQIEKLIESHELSTALLQTEEWLQSNPESSAALALKGRIWYHRGDKEAGCKLVAQALDIDPENPWILSVLGKYERDAGNLHLALEYQKRALAARPQSTVLYADIGDIYALMQNYEKAAESYKKVIDSLDQSPPRILYMYGKSLQETGDGVGAQPYYQKAFELAPGDSKIAYGLARISLRNGDLQNAIRAGEAAAQIAPEYADVYIILAGAYLDANSREASKMNLQKALDLGHPSAKTLMDIHFPEV